MPENTVIGTETVKTPDIARYFNLGIGATPDWQMAGTGFNSMGENPNAQTSKTQYVSDRTSTSDVDGYESQWAFDTDLIKNQKCVMHLYDISYYRKTGIQTQFEILIVDMFQPIEGEANTYKARKQLVSAEISGMDGEPGKTLHITGNLNAVGDQETGVFSTTAKTFTSDSEVDNA